VNRRELATFAKLLLPGALLMAMSAELLTPFVLIDLGFASLF
jgi:hypothetical protein